MAEPLRLLDVPARERRQVEIGGRQLMPIACWTVGRVCERVSDEAVATRDRCEQIKLVSCDMAGWIAVPIGERCPSAEICLDPFHVIKVRPDALPVRAGCKTPPPGCRGSPVKLRTA